MNKKKRKALVKKGVEEMPKWMRGEKHSRKKLYLRGKRIMPPAITGREKAAELIEQTFLAYNSARLREGCSLFVEKMLKPDVTVGMSLAGALTPAGLGKSCLVPLIEKGMVDWIVSTGANLYHDLHFALDLELYAGSHRVDDRDLRKNGVVRIYDILLGYLDCLCATDVKVKQALRSSAAQKTMGTAELHYILGGCADRWEREMGVKGASLLAAAYRVKLPVYTSSPGDSAIGMIAAGEKLIGSKLCLDPFIDVNETSAIVYGAKQAKRGKSAVVMVGGGSPKNFILQTEPYIQEMLHIPDIGHDYFLQFTDARPDTGGLSGATPHEAVSWGKVDPEKLPDAVVCYLDSTVALPMLTHCALALAKKRPLRRLYTKREQLLKILRDEYRKQVPREDLGLFRKQ